MTVAYAIPEAFDAKMIYHQVHTYVYLSVKATRPHQCWVQDVWSVGASQDNYISRWVKP